VVEQHQREQPARLRFLGREGELAGEADRLAGQVHPARVAGRVDEVEHPEHDGEVARLVEAMPAQGALGPADPLRHRRLGNVERVGDLPGAQAADGAQGQRHLGRGREVGMAAAEQQEEGVVGRLGGGGPRFGVRRLLAAPTGSLAAAGVDQSPGRDRRQPRARVARRVLGPYPQRLEQRLLQRVLRCIEVLAPPDQAREHPRDENAQRALVEPSRRSVGHARFSRPELHRTSPRGRRSTRTAAPRPGRARRRRRPRARPRAPGSRRRPCTSPPRDRWSPAVGRRW
jgi:hypothetical protein